MKKVLILAMALFMLAGVSACGGGNPVGNVVDSVVSRLSGDVIGEVGKTYETEWFTFEVNRLEVLESYKGAEAEEGTRFLVISVYEKNTWAGEEAIPMSCDDFVLTVDGGEEKIYPEEPWDEAMMPFDFYLDPEEECTYDVIFVVSEEVTAVNFIYEEVDENEDTHATFTIKHRLET